LTRVEGGDLLTRVEGGDLSSSSWSHTQTSELGGWGLGMRRLILGSTQNWWWVCQWGYRMRGC